MEGQYISLLASLGTLAVLVGGFLYNNSRMNALRDVIEAQLGGLQVDIPTFEAGFRRMEETLRAEIAKNHREMLAKFAELDSRLSRIEAHLKLR